jgi:hypothetical protein
LKTASDELIRKRVLRTGDGSHDYSKLTQKDENGNFIEENLPAQQYWGLGEIYWN